MTKYGVKFPIQVLQPIRDYLLKRESQVKKSRKQLEKEDPFADTTRLNDNAAVDAEAAEEYGHERVTALKSELDKTLIRIRKALSRIKVGNYGVCSGCKKLIDTDRLAIDPTADLCVKCAKSTKKQAQ
ncbi:hypothetical protein A2160_05880 [Candidatus Beckwithbacteria bacterium RBG_13_42_9]|uniref:Zinc finger DksA/TraR C4-type domain-containing protein n=1 Tax=Candidatus Beckwithbacteria bacterium RBG_13_42_9 TaxID=1797457 RepID=A0A1F5E571_9BACT|nr:MAG: hypothetical protein A2160_05880 [Candidatus Beckwithbacteria bacterium RBG_13_42_9]